jgi:membrane protein implicated in regulation of membrane protease activity
LSTVYLAAIGFGVTLLVASLVLGGKDTDGAGDAHGDAGDGLVFAWAPIFSLRFWVFFLAFGGGAGFALEQLGSSKLVSLLGALGVGWAAGALAVMIVSRLAKTSVSSALVGSELVGTTGTLVLPIAPGQPGKVRVEVKGRAEDFVANGVDDNLALATGTAVMIVSEGDRGTLLVTKADV